jgi:hypothetical protein
VLDHSEMLAQQKPMMRSDITMQRRHQCLASRGQRVVRNVRWASFQGCLRTCYAIAQ